MDVVEPQYERSKYQDLYEKKEEVTEDAAEEVCVGESQVREWRQDNEKESRTDYLA